LRQKIPNESWTEQLRFIIHLNRPLWSFHKDPALLAL